jgi:hypothetical protein
MKKYLPIVFGLLLLAFATLTFFLSASVIFDLFNVRASQGNYVLFIVVTNLICSLLYFIAVYGFVKKKSWTVYILSAALSLLLLVFAYFNIYINNGGIYENKTYGAMMFRMTVTAVFTLMAYFTIPKKGRLYD